MPSTFTQNFYHAVFSTKHRVETISPDLELRLHPFLGGILRDIRCTAIAINGMAEHVHILATYPPHLSHSDMLMNVKARSSKWIHETCPGMNGFAWQEGYAGFTVSRSVVPAVKEYIERQKEHHKRIDYRTEVLELLRRHDVEFDEEEVFK